MRAQAIERVLENWFSVKSGHVSIENDFLRVKFWQLDRKFGENYNVQESMMDFMRKCYEILNQESLKMTQDEWKQAYHDSVNYVTCFSQNEDKYLGKGFKIANDKSVLAKLNSYVTGSIEFVYREEIANQSSIRVRNGTKNGYTLVQLDALNLGSIVLQNEDDDAVTTSLTNENSLYVDDDYIMSHFQIWYLDNKNKLLTKKQMQFLQGWIKADFLDVTEAERVEATGVERGNHNYYLKSIAKRILKGYNKEKPLQNTSYQLQLKRFIDLVQPLNELHESKNLETMNEMMLDYIHRHYSVLQPSLKLTALEHQQMNRKEFNNQTLYKIFNQLQDKCERYQAIIAELESVIDEDLVQYKVPSTTINHFENIEKGAKYAKIIGRDGYAVTIDEDENEN